MEYKTAKRMECLPFSGIRAVMEKATKMQQAGEKVLEDNIRTVDIMSDGMTLVGCKEMGDEIVNRL